MSHDLNTGGDRGYLRIATEEAFATREQIDAFLRMVGDGTADKGMTSLWGFYARSPSPRATEIIERLLDLGERRIADMDATGIDVAILSLTSPGVQPLFDVDEAKAMVTRANNSLADACAKYPTRYVGMTSIAPQDPEWSAAEIRRGADELGFRGVMVNSHTQGHYLDEPQFDPIFRALADTGQPLYIHPQTLPDDMIGGLIDAGLDGAIFGFAVETAMHLLRLMTTGIFDRYPDLKMVGAEVDCGWAPFWVQTLDHHWDIQKSWLGPGTACRSRRCSARTKRRRRTSPTSSSPDRSPTSRSIRTARPTWPTRMAARNRNGCARRSSPAISFRSSKSRLSSVERSRASRMRRRAPTS